MWSSIVNGHVIKNDGMWSLRDNGTWNGLQVLYNRKCYDEIIEQLKRFSCALIYGTPGIGKSTFLFRYLVHIVEERRKNNGAIPSIIFASRVGLETVEYWLHGDGRVEIIPTAQRSADYYLSDSVDSPTIRANTLHLEVASENENNYHQFRKHIITLKSLEYCMDVFSFEELSAIKGSMPEDEATFRYLIVGGSARLFMLTGSAADVVKEEVKEALLWYFASTNWTTTYQATFNAYCTLISSTLMSTTEETKKLGKSLFVHTGIGIINGVKRVHRKPASEFMKYIVSRLSDAKDNRISTLLSDIVSESGMGNLFEYRMHRKFATPNFVFTAKPLTKPYSRSGNKNDTLKVTVGYPVVLLRKIEDIANLTEGKYGLPIVNNFPLVDAIIQPNILIQYTIAQHHKGAVAELENIRRGLKGPWNTHAMIFVVPKATIVGNKFQYQNDLEKIDQYVATEDEVTSENVLQTPNDKKRTLAFTSTTNDYDPNVPTTRSRGTSSNQHISPKASKAPRTVSEEKEDESATPNRRSARLNKHK